MRRRILEKQKEAEARASARAKRSHTEQLSLLDSRLGVGLGATKERARIKDLIENPKVEEKSTKKKKSKKEDFKKDELTV